MQSNGSLVRVTSVGAAVGLFPWVRDELVHIGEIIAAESVSGQLQHVSLEEPQMELLKYAVALGLGVVIGMLVYGWRERQGRWRQSIEERVHLMEQELRRRPG
jgi:hypothetical protein